MLPELGKYGQQVNHVELMVFNVHLSELRSTISVPVFLFRCLKVINQLFTEVTRENIIKLLWPVQEVASLQSNASTSIRDCHGDDVEFFKYLPA